MTLVIPAPIRAELAAAARAAAPLEACGLLTGDGERVTRFYLMTNADASADHFSMQPAEQFAVYKEMRNRGLKLLAIWHSHPATPARMSDEDLRLAFTPDVVYVILSLAPGDAAPVRGFLVHDGKPAEIALELEAG